MDFHAWYDDNLQRLIKGNLHDALHEAWQSAQQAEREREKDLVDALRNLLWESSEMTYATEKARAAIAKYEGEINEP